MNQDDRRVSFVAASNDSRAAGARSDVAGILLAHAEATPTKIAVRDSRGSLTWRELAGYVSALALRLERDGVGQGAPVLLLADTCVETIVAYWALRSLGAIAVIGDPGCTRHEFDHYVEATQPGWVLSTRGGTWERLGLDSTGPATATSLAMRWYLQDQDPTVPGLRAWLPRTTSGASRNDRFAEATGARLVLFSSGTTGVPKTIVHTEASVEALNRLHADAWGLRRDDVVLGCLPFHTIYGSIYTAASTIYNGATLGLMERFKPEVALARIEEWGVTTAAMVPAMLSMMLGVPDKERFDVSTLRGVYVGAAPTSDQVIDDFAEYIGAPVLGSYGLTECPGAAVEPSDRAHVPGAAGRICAGFEVVVRDVEGNALPPGDTGEITLRGPSRMLGYLGQPELTSRRIRDGWVYTEDIGRVDAEGNVFIQGRSTDMIIRGGLNIAPKEVEDVLIQHPDVVLAAVIGTDDELFGQVVKAFVMPRAADDLQALREELVAHCSARLNRAKVPATIVFVRDFPMNAGGKVIRDQLVGPALESRLLGIGTVSLRDYPAGQMAILPTTTCKAR